MNRLLGIAIHRRELAAVMAEPPGRLAWQARQGIAPGQTPVQTLRSLLSLVPAELRCREVRIALSPRWLACADLLEVKLRSEAQIEAVARSLAEGRCAGESAEDLAVDVVRLTSVPSGSRVAVHGISQVLLDELRSVIKERFPDASLSLVTSTLAALAEVLAQSHDPRAVALEAGGEGLIVAIGKDGAEQWRAFPVRGLLPTPPDEWTRIAASLGAPEDALHIHASEATPVELGEGFRVEPAFVPAVAACLADPQRGANLLRGATGAPRSAGARLGGTLQVLGAAAVLVLAALAFLFHVKTRNAAEVSKGLRQAEESLWKEAFPAKSFRAGFLLQEMEAVATRQEKNAQANDLPSALKFWSELGSVMPDADKTGLTLDALQLGPDGGRLTARMEARGSDGLQEAANLERAMNASKRLAARGEFEARGKEVLVRMRLDYKPGEPGSGR
ncbi:MAG: hypothetical protein L6R28_13410 [Planctomycetes bacterium]|nr:hypothetical protein [Planctomycetota bacterium]